MTVLPLNLVFNMAAHQSSKLSRTLGLPALTVLPPAHQMMLAASVPEQHCGQQRGYAEWKRALEACGQPGLYEVYYVNPPNEVHMRVSI